MTAYVHGPDFRFVLEFEGDDVREVAPVIRDLIQQGTCLMLSFAGVDESQLPAPKLLINFGLFGYMLVTSNPPDEEEGKEPRLRLPTSLAATEIRRA